MRILTSLLACLAAVASFAAADIGKAAPEFTGKTLDGKTVSLADLKGKTVVLEWYNPGCPAVRKFYDAGKMQEFQKEHGFQTSVRGLKVRTPTYGSLEEAEEMVKKVRERDPTHDIYIGQVGKWMPWDPDAYKTGRLEFMEPELNRLHHEKTKNEAKAKMEFEQRVRDTKKKAIMENIKLAEKNNNRLTQTLDEQGNLVGVREKVDFESREPATDEMKEKQREEVFQKAAAETKKSPL